MILGAGSEGGELAAAADFGSKSVLENFLGVDAGFLRDKLSTIELLLYLSVAVGLAGGVVSAIKLRAR